MLANGLELTEAVREAQDYTWHALQKAYRPGMGQFLPDRLFWAREQEGTADGSGESDEAKTATSAPAAALLSAQLSDLHRH
jgi:hydroxymethylpyrimidine/phosphomethylpyrimidine kinase